MSCQVKIEVILSKVHSNKVSYETYLLEGLKKAPDELVLEHLRDLNLQTYENYIVHSTSWRYIKPSAIILTYLVVIPLEEDIDLQNFLDIRTTSIAKSKVAYIPTPDKIELANVLSHAFRHLAFLILRDKSDTYCSLLSKNQCDYILSCGSEPAKEINSLL